MRDMKHPDASRPNDPEVYDLMSVVQRFLLLVVPLVSICLQKFFLSDVNSSPLRSCHRFLAELEIVNMGLICNICFTLHVFLYLVRRIH